MTFSNLHSHQNQFSSDHHTVTFSNQNSYQNLFFLKITIKGRYELYVHIAKFSNKDMHLHKHLFRQIPSENPGNTK